MGLPSEEASQVPATIVGVSPVFRSWCRKSGSLAGVELHLANHAAIGELDHRGSLACS